MTTLKNLKGTAIQFLDADPVVYAGAWASGANVNTARQYLGGIGSTTAGLIFGGSTGSNSAVTEQYNGTAWTEVNDLNAVQIAQASAGTLTSGMSAAGAVSPGANVEDWNGSSWATNPHSINSARQFLAGDGPSNDSVLVVGGEPAPNGALTEIYNGSSWTEVADLNAQRNQLAGVGTVTAFLAVGGSPATNDAELWNGSSWTEVADLNDGSPGLSASGDSGLALAFAGAPGFAATNEAWNGTAWTEVGDLSTGRNFAGSSNNAGNTSAFIASGNTSPGLITATEEWSFPPVTATTLNEGDMWFNSSSSTLKGYQLSTPTGTWASGGSLNTARRELGASGTQTAGLGFGGSTGSVSALNEEYNGTSWTEKADLNAAKTNGAGTPAGTTTAALFFGGFVTDNVATNESWNGTAWSEQNDLNQARRGIGGAGTQTAALGFMGQTPGDSANTETWNGTSWTEVNNLNTARGSGGGAGTQTAALCSGGYGPSGNTGITEKWDGTSWTETGDLNTARNELEQAGTQNSMLAFGGAPSSGTAATEFFNGTSWTEINDLSTARFSVAGIGSSVAALAGGGANPSVTALTEEFAAGSAVVTVTTS